MVFIVTGAAPDEGMFILASIYTPPGPDFCDGVSRVESSRVE